MDWGVLSLSHGGENVIANLAQKHQSNDKTDDQHHVQRFHVHVGMKGDPRSAANVGNKNKQGKTTNDNDTCAHIHQKFTLSLFRG